MYSSGDRFRVLFWTEGVSDGKAVELPSSGVAIGADDGVPPPSGM